MAIFHTHVVTHDDNDLYLATSSVVILKMAGAAEQSSESGYSDQMAT